MPLTEIFYPILSQFFCIVEKRTGEPVMPLDGGATAQVTAEDDKKLPPGIVLGPDGKPCRTCTSGAAWKNMMKTSSFKPTATAPPAAKAATSSTTASDCPPDVEALGRSSWTLLHTMAATYPERPSLQQQRDASSMISSLSRLYPCYWCATDFQKWMTEARNAPRVTSRTEFGQWLCEAHNEVNRKLGKEEFDCTKVDERWRTGWKDGRCD